MNYFAHARMAATRRRDPHFVLGAMLPDWTAWVGARIERVDHPALAEGIRFHHHSDAAFHASPRFTAHVREASASLREAGLARGPARAVAHVGIELLLDGALFAARGEQASRTAYRAALAAAHSASTHLAWSRPAAATRLPQIAERLQRDGLPAAFDDPDRVAYGIARTLSRRPRLRVDDAQLPELRAWARRAQRDVRRDAHEMLAETEERLAEREVA